MKKTTLILTAVAALLAACSRPAPPEEPVRAVKVMTVGIDTFSSGYEFAGEVRAQVESRLGFRVGGKIIFMAEDVTAYLATCRVGVVAPIASTPRVQIKLKHLRLA